MNYRDYKDLVKEDIKTEQDLKKFLDIIIEEYFQTGDRGQFLSSLKLASEIKGGLTKLSKKTKLQREHLYIMLSQKGNPSFDNIAKIIKALGYEIMIKPSSESRV